MGKTNRRGKEVSWTDADFIADSTSRKRLPLAWQCWQQPIRRRLCGVITADPKLINGLAGRYRLQGGSYVAKATRLPPRPTEQSEHEMDYVSAGDFQPLDFDAVAAETQS
jgi:hypothetical protein